MNATAAYRFTIVVPVFNERDNLTQLEKRLGAYLPAALAQPACVLFVDDGSDNWRLLDGMITVQQTTSQEFLEPSAAMFNVEAAGQNVRLRILANVDWDYEIEPMEEYATENGQ